MARRRPLGLVCVWEAIVRFQFKIPFVGRLVRRRLLAALRAEQQAYRSEVAQHNEAVARILAQASDMPPSRRSWR